MESRVGYSHAYDFSAAKLEEINSRQKAYRWYGRQRLLIFEMRSEFMIKGPDLRKSIGSERYDLGGLVVGCNTKDVRDVIERRLDEYWMSEAGINKFCEEAATFGNRQAAEEEGTGSNICIAVIARMEVVTVQLKREPLTYTKMRAVLPQKMSPLHVWHVQTVERREMSYKLMDFLFSLPRVRAESEEELGDRGTYGPMCCICFLPLLFLGAFITKLDCGCAFHSHCIMRKLERSNRCHYCETQVYDADYLAAPPFEEWWWEDEDLFSYGLRSF